MAKRLAKTTTVKAAIEETKLLIKQSISDQAEMYRLTIAIRSLHTRPPNRKNGSQIGRVQAGGASLPKKLVIIRLLTAPRKHDGQKQKKKARQS